jgi:hypothetical protein
MALLEQVGLPLIISHLIDDAIDYGYDSHNDEKREKLVQQIKEVSEWLTAQKEAQDDPG